MDATKEAVNPNPRDGANPLSVLFFTFTFDIFRKGYRKTLDVEDLYNPLKKDRSKLLGNVIQRNWEKELETSTNNNKEPSLAKALIKTFWLDYFWLGLNSFSSELMFIAQPLMLGRMLTYFNPKNTTISKEDALLSAAAIVILNFFAVILTNQYMLEVFHVGMQIRAACCALIYRKALRLSKTALGDTASGKIVNLLSNDVSRFDYVSLFINQMWIGPTISLIIMGLLYKDAGWPGVLGVIVVFTVVPLQSYTMKLSAKYRKQTAVRTDERVRLMDEIIGGIQVIKMYAWEKPFDKIITLARRAEIKIITKSSYVRALYMTFNLFTTRFALFCTLLTMAVTKEPITAAKVFVFMSYFNQLSMGMGAMFVRGISEIAEVIVGIRRLQEFLMNEEFRSNESQINLNDKEIMLSYDHIVTLQDVTVKWNAEQAENALEKLNLHITDGQLFGIIGPVGSGKSSLLNTLLGELDVTDGKMKINGTMSYASQEPWVFAATLRQNILFGAKYDKARYQEVVHVCALEKDFEQFPNGDMTIVGDRGASLSGGQKARINLARAVYRDTDIYLFDDPLSAVDIHVSKHLYEKCICGYLKNKTRILVTHQVHYLKNADHIIILKNGAVEDEGTFQELANSENLYAKLLTAEPEDPEAMKTKQEEARRIRKLSVSRKSSLTSALSEISLASLVDTIKGDEYEGEDEEEENQVQMKDLQEESSKGKIKGSILLKYLLAGGNGFLFLILLSLYLITQLAASGTDFWVTNWVNVIEIHNKTPNSTYTTALPIVELSTELCLTIYGIFIIGLFIIGLSRSMMFYKLAMLSSKRLHRMMFNSVVAASMRFFDTNPSGRILNRFSKDIGAVDELLPKVILDAAQILLLTFGALCLIVLTNPYFLILILILSVVFGFIRHVFLKSSKNIKRLEGIMRSPVFTHLNATLQGLTTIRAFGAQDILSDEFDKHQDYHTSAWYMYISASSAFGFWLDLFCTLFMGVITFSFLTYGKEFQSGGNVGLAISQATSLTFFLQWGMRQSSEVINQLLSVERVLEYEMLPKEVEPAKPVVAPKAWPETGQLVFENAGLRYIADGPLILKKLNFIIKPKEKVGVVGRTGAGKSSLISALFRLAPVEGYIKIDGIDTKNLSLATLRTNISIIPQDPVLFSGTLRYNLDPFEEYPDDALYKAIEDVELKDPANIINRLENRVMDRGSNYSVGQRQLICLARAIVRNNKILMLDEATANVDPQTDTLIQKTIRKKFVDCTVITVAHRLNTIMDSDKVLVMDAGTVLEFDHPHILLQNKNGTFYKMVTETGKALSEQLRKTAFESYQRYSSLPE